jgi:hypothetical protein
MLVSSIFSEQKPGGLRRTMVSDPLTGTLNVAKVFPMVFRGRLDAR